MRGPTEETWFKKIGEDLNKAPRDLSEKRYNIQKIGHLDDNYLRRTKRRDDGSYDKFRDVPKSFAANLRMSLLD